MQTELKGFEIEYNIDLAAFQGKDIPADKNAKANYFMRSANDKVSGYKDSKVPNATELGLKPDGTTKSTGHHASNFPTSDLPSSNKNSDQKKDVNQNP